MSRSAMELDFFGMEKKLSPPPKPSSYERRRSFRDIQGVVSKINPEVLKTVIANGSFGLNKSGSVPCTPKEDTAFPSLPLHDSTIRQNCDPKKGSETAPMTIFYNGIVAVFDVSPDKAQDILLLAEEVVQKPAESSDSKVTSDQKNILGTLNGDFPIARRQSLQRFLEKRKERFRVRVGGAHEENDVYKEMKEFRMMNEENIVESKVSLAYGKSLGLLFPIKVEYGGTIWMSKQAL